MNKYTAATRGWTQTRWTPLFEAGEFVRTVQRAQDLPIAIVEEIAYENGWITRDQLMESAERYGKSPYGRHLKGIADGEIMLVPNQKN